MKTFTVIAELVDYRDGSRHYPGDPFTPEDQDHADRLIAAGCLPKDGSAPVVTAPPEKAEAFPALFGQSTAALIKIAAAEGVDLTGITKYAAIRTAIMTAREKKAGQ